MSKTIGLVLPKDFWAKVPNPYFLVCSYFGGLAGVADELSYLLNEESTLPYYFDLLNLKDIGSPELLAHIAEYGVQLRK